MEKTIHKWLFLSAVLFNCWWVATTAAQDFNLKIHLHDGTVRTIPANEIASIAFEESKSQAPDGLTGQWLLVASPAGIAGDGGVYTTHVDTIRFTAAWGNDPETLVCHADTFCILSGVVYPADWQVQVSQNEQDGTYRLGWVLSEKTPVCTQSGDHLYLLSENISTQRLEGMTLWSDWQATTAATFTFPQYQEIYGVLSPTVPYSSPSSRYLEIWASPRFIKVP